MNTKEAIEFLVKEYDVYKNTPLESGYEAVLELLQRGEKYEQMWWEVIEYFGNDLDLYEYMNDVKHKYFLK